MAPPLKPAGGRLAGRRWAAVAGLAMVALLLLAWRAPDRGQRLAEHEPMGPLREVAAERVLRLEIARGDALWRLRREGGGWVAAPALAASGAALDERVEMALRLLRNSAVERELEAALPEYGIDVQALRVAVSTDAPAPVLRAAFGRANPVGLARYTQLRSGDAAQTVLLPAYVAEAWEAVLK